MKEKRIIISAQGIHKSFPVSKSSELEVLKGIDLKIGKGEIVAIVGKSGVGKSTLLHIMGALDRPTRGNVLINGTDVFSVSDYQRAYIRNRMIGFIFQFHYLLPEFTALENVAMPGLISRYPFSDVIKKAEQLLEEVGLSDRAKHKPKEMSGGEQQRVAFARALVNDPEVVLADEPSGNLDQANSDALHELMWKLVREKNITFVVVTHNRELAHRADKIFKMVDGKIFDGVDEIIGS